MVYSLEKAKELRYGAVLFGGNIGFYGKSGFDFFPVMAVDLGLFFLVAASKNLVGDGIVVLFIVRLFDDVEYHRFQLVKFGGT